MSPSLRKGDSKIQRGSSETSSHFSYILRRGRLHSHLGPQATKASEISGAMSTVHGVTKHLLCAPHRVSSNEQINEPVGKELDGVHKQEPDESPDPAQQSIGPSATLKVRLVIKGIPTESVQAYQGGYYLGYHEGTHKEDGGTGPEPHALSSGDEDCCRTAHRYVDVYQTSELRVVEGIHGEPSLRPVAEVHNQEQENGLKQQVTTKYNREEEHTW